jgi:7-carboxy-7-deazaguanine synthase
MNLETFREIHGGAISYRRGMITSLLAPSDPALDPRTHPVIEIFGPTIQGEGAEAGVATHFVRLGGCDYRCTWCDTMYAVDPKTVRETSRRMSGDEIVAAVNALPGRPGWVSISGGNPALHELGGLVDGLHAAAYKVAVETQGSRWRPWLGRVDRLTVSPKPPSSGMVSAAHDAAFAAFMRAAAPVAGRVVLKIACFDETDVRWAKDRIAAWPQAPAFLSAGTPVPAPGDVRTAVATSYRWLCERVAADPELAGARVLPQLHVIAWGDAAGV